MKVSRSVEITADEIGEALHAAKSIDVYEVPVRFKRDGRWHKSRVMFEAEDRDEARRQLARVSGYLSDAEFDARKLRKLRKSSPEKA